MPESAVVDQPVAGSETVLPGNQQTQAPGWLAGLPAEIRDNEAFKPYKTVGDLGKAHIETAQKAKEYEGKLANSIPKLGANATQEERNSYLNALGRPEKPEGYELEGGDKAKEQAIAPWKQDFYELGLTADQAKGIKARFDARLNGLVEAHNASILQANTKAETELKAEWGDKYAANVELVSRLWKRDTDSEFDKAFEGIPFTARKSVMRYMFKMAAKTGEDMSPSGGVQRSAQPAAGYDLSSFKLPPKRT